MTRHAIWIAITLVFTVGAAAEDEALTTTTRDLARAEGEPQVRYETTLRGKTRIMLTRLERADDGTFVPRARSYYFGRELAMIESDEDRDGFFEQSVLYRNVGGEERVEGFVRSPGGAVHAMDAEALRKIRQMGESWKEFWEAALPPK